MSTTAEKRILYVNRPELVRIMLSNCLGYMVAEGPEQLLIPDDPEQPCIQLMDAKGSPGASRITLFTNNCLRDFVGLQHLPVSDGDEPSYREGGLAYDFSDPWANHYTLIEKRNYQEGFVYAL